MTTVRMRWRGSSPLARGLRRTAGQRADPRWIIPARAGFTRSSPRMSASARDHPRSRGVYRWVIAGVPQPAGSSPLARGLRAQRGCPRARIRIIPARAGFTRSPARSTASQQDHPRSRGVYREDSTCAWLPHGSSPLARGLLFMHMIQITNQRIIPARAGFTPNPSFSYPHAWDHPRSRGVYGAAVHGLGSFRGSSPLARGLRSPWGTRQIVLWIIPARAGFTAGMMIMGAGYADHPRSRGVYFCLS